MNYGSEPVSASFQYFFCCYCQTAWVDAFTQRWTYERHESAETASHSEVNLKALKRVPFRKDKRIICLFKSLVNQPGEQQLVAASGAG